MWAIVASLRSIKCTDCFFQILSAIFFDEAFHRTNWHYKSQWSWDLVSFPSKKRNDNGYGKRLEKTWDVSTWLWNLKNSKYHTTGDIQRSTCQSVGGLLLLSCDFLGHPPGGKDAIYRYPGSHCYGLLRKRQNGGRPEAQEGPKDTTSCAMWILKHFVYKNG